MDPTPAPATPAAVETTDYRAPTPTTRHVWIDPVNAAPAGEQHAGLLHAWQPTRSGWIGLVTYLVDDGGPLPVTVTQWLHGDTIHRI